MGKLNPLMYVHLVIGTENMLTIFPAKGQDPRFFLKKKNMSYGEAPVLGLLGMWSHPFVAILLVPLRASSIGQIDLKIIYIR